MIGTIDLGISVLLGGNVDVQARMLNHLREKKEVGFFTSVAGLMQQCRYTAGKMFHLDFILIYFR